MYFVDIKCSIIIEITMSDASHQTADLLTMYFTLKVIKIDGVKFHVVMCRMLWGAYQCIY